MTKNIVKQIDLNAADMPDGGMYFGSTKSSAGLKRSRALRQLRLARQFRILCQHKAKEHAASIRKQYFKTLPQNRARKIFG